MSKTVFHLSGFLLFSILVICGCNNSPQIPLRVVTELNIGESQDIKLPNGNVVKLTLIEINLVRDSLREAIRAAYVKVSVDGEEIKLISGKEK